MSWWEDRVVPHLTDAALARPEVMELRRRACVGLRGDVVELGFGSGLNLGCLDPAVTSVDAVEPSELGWARSAVRRASTALPVRRTGLDGQALTAHDATYDSALTTFTLCTIPDAAAALREVRRVLRPGSRFHFLEHGRAPGTRAHRWQRRLEPLQRVVFGGCHLTRDPVALLTANDFEVEAVEELDLAPGPGAVWGHLYLGTARPIPG